MDSLSQIVLGAACAEVVLGKKIGNKALLFGAIGGTIPDLDVLLGSLFYANEIDQMAFHRGFMHSLLFAFLASFLIGFIVHKLYDTGKRTHITTLKDWILLFFFSIFTHPILDSFTPYGTQLFLPFSDTRVAFNNISVVDPIYTLPFLFCLIVTLFYKRTNPKRLKWTKAGIFISSFYMLFTIGNKLYINTVFKKSFEKASISINRYRTQPTIFNNVLWYGIAETDKDYKVAFYSLFDKSSTADKILSIPKNHYLLDMNETDLKTMSWFSNGYYRIDTIESDKIIYYDLRYAMINASDSINSVMNFELQKKGSRWTTIPFNNFRPAKETFAIFWKRLLGN